MRFVLFRAEQTKGCPMTEVSVEPGSIVGSDFKTFLDKLNCVLSRFIYRLKNRNKTQINVNFTWGPSPRINGSKDLTRVSYKTTKQSSLIVSFSCLDTS